MKSSILPLIALLLIALASMGCESSDNKVSPEGRPSAFFTVSQTETSSSFILKFSNQSTASNGSTSGLTYRWTFEGKGESTVRAPSDRTYTRSELGLTDKGQTTSRSVSLTVFEDNDEERVAHYSETVIFEVTAGDAIKVTLQSGNPVGSENHGL